MLAAVRLTSKIERRLKKLEREFTRPMPAMKASAARGRVEPRFESAAFHPTPDPEGIRRDLANNDNGSAPIIALAPLKAPPVAPDRDGLSASVPSISIDALPRAAAEAPEPVKSTPAPAPKQSGDRGAVLRLSMLAATAFLLSFAVVYQIA